MQPGSTYFIQAGNFSPVPVQWWETFTFGLTIVPPPANDNFANAKVISSLPFDESVDVTGATTESGEPNPSPLCGGDISKSVWYSFTATTSGMYNAGISGGSQGGVNVYTGSWLDNLTRVACGSSATGVGAFHADAGTTYYLQSGTWMGGSGALLGARLELTPPPAVDFIWGPSFPTRFDNITFQGRYLDPIGIDSWAWDFGDGGTGTGQFAQHQFAQDGDYSVTVTATTPDGRSNSSTTVVRVRTPDTPPVITVPAGVTANATSPNGAIVTYAVTATDDNPSPPTVNCTPPSGATFPIGETTVTCAATDATGNTATASFTVDVKGAVEQLVDLFDKVIGVGSGTSLADKVGDAQRELAQGDIAGTYGNLRAFINQVKDSPARKSTRRPQRHWSPTPPASQRCSATNKSSTPRGKTRPAGLPAQELGVTQGIPRTTSRPHGCRRAGARLGCNKLGRDAISTRPPGCGPGRSVDLSGGSGSHTGRRRRPAMSHLLAAGTEHDLPPI